MVSYLKTINMNHTIPKAERLGSIGEYYFSLKLREIDKLNQQGNKIINFGIGSPDLPPHQSVIDILHSESLRTNTHSYQSYKGAAIFRNAIADWYKKWYEVDLDPLTEILPLIGSKEGIMHLCMTYLNPGDKAFVPNPGYPTYNSAVTLAGGVPTYYPLKEKNNWQPDFEELDQTDFSNVKLFFTNYPHMPTGQNANNETFDRLIELALKHNFLLINDNPYSFILNSNPASILLNLRAKEVCIELNSLSKSHNMAGWRVGMMLAKEQVITDVLSFKSNMDSGMFLPIQLAAAKALALDASWFKQLNNNYLERRKYAFDILRILQCQFSETQVGMFVWASIPENWTDAYQLSNHLLDKFKIFITPGGVFGSEGNKYLRISLCSGLEVFKEAIKRLK